MTRAEFQLVTVTCPSCIKKIESALSKTEGVNSAKVLFNSSKVKAEFDESQISAEKLKEIIVNLGYPVLSSRVS
jgi:copper chaperone CopZ